MDHQQQDHSEDLNDMADDEFHSIFQYTHLDSNMVSKSPPGLKSGRESEETMALVPNPGTYHHKAVSDTDPDVDKGLKLDRFEEDHSVLKVADAPWYPHALRFLARVPQSDADWSRHISCNGDIRSLCRRLKLPILYPKFKDHPDWSRLFENCTHHLARVCNNPPVASLFSITFVATCQVALVHGCSRDTVLKGLESCGRQCGMAENELTELDLDNVREGVITGIRLMTEYTRIVGCRANEIPLHAQDCLQLFQHCDSACFSFIKSRISSTYRPTVPLQSEYLEIPALVYELLGGEVSYQAVCQILCPGQANGVCGYSSVDMTDVMEFNERDDGNGSGDRLNTSSTPMLSIVHK